ncbi:hypothetical protein [Methylobacterium indicum]|uniref:Uncharacterized protein n=1 Tax=Methylobacterium indicum TaxID=1775910 RepID=A0A8H8X0M1_9HYPH|nr:hypothetical protein [Methylobacterium indicum]BCM88031.1 hypothetical protein mvi_64920 [Methylobacterium indicum]
MKIKEANAKLEAQVRIQTWLIGAIGLMPAILGLTHFYLKFVG